MFILVEIIIHPRWLMEDIAIINLIELLFIWAMVPIKIEFILSIIIMFIFELEDIILMGMIFWIVIRISELFHVILEMILGNHEWIGAIAIFVARAVVIIMFMYENIICDKKRFLFNLFIKLINNSDEAIVWIIKYFIAFSPLFFVFSVTIIMMKTDDLNSRKIHTKIQESHIKAISGDRKISNINVIFII